MSICNIKKEEKNEMRYEIGDEVRCAYDGSFGIIAEVDEESGIYTVDFDGELILVSESEIC